MATDTSARPPVWQLIKEAVEQLGGSATYTQIIDYVHRTYGDVNDNTIRAQAVVCTVNMPSRIHYPENQRPRSCNSRYDFLYSTGRGQVELYNPERHGVWELRADENGRMLVVLREVEAPPPVDVAIVEEQNRTAGFALESHLRDFIARNIETMSVAGLRLQLYVDEQGSGVEYRTGVGPIDILATDSEGGLVVFELKVERGPDSAMGQILRYIGWLRQHKAQGRSVRGVIVARSIDEKLRYAAAAVPDVTLFEYELSFNVRPVSNAMP